MDLHFVDRKIEGSLKKFIRDDLELIFGHLTGHESYKKEGFEKHIYFTGEGRYIPRLLTEKFGDVVSVDGADKLMVNKEVLDAYQLAYNLEKEGVIQGLRELIENLRKEDGTEESSIADNFLFQKEYVESSGYGATGIEGAPEEMKKEFLRQWRSFNLRMPSVLEIGTGSTDLQGMGRGGEWASRLYVVENGIPVHEWPVTTEGGKWKVFIYSPGT